MSVDDQIEIGADLIGSQLGRTEHEHTESKRTVVEFTIRETTHMTGRITVDHALFKQMFGYDFDLDRIPEDDLDTMLQRYELAAIDAQCEEAEHTETNRNITGQEWSDFSEVTA